jgi:sporulation protein YlmC with PRC-barrel domain
MENSSNTDETRKLIASNKVEGTAVYNTSGDKLGTINNFMVDKASGQAEYAVMQFGGFLGMGTDNYPIPWSMLQYDVEHGGYVVDLDKDQLDEAPRFQTEEPAFDENYDRQVYGHYGLTY